MNKRLKKIEVFNLLNEILVTDLMDIKYEKNIRFNMKKGSKEIFLENIISLFLFNEKNILLLCNSYKDIENISIIKELGNKVIYLNKNNDNLIKKLEYEIENLKEITGKTFINKVYLINRKFIKNITKIDNINKFFYDKDDVSLIDLYYKSNRKISKYSDMYKDYSIFRIKGSIINKNFEELHKIKTKIINDKVYDKYIRYRRYKDNTKLKILNEKIDNENIDTFIKKIKEINKNDKIRIMFNESQYIKDFLESYIHNSNLDDKDIKTIANMINVKHNSYILKEEEVSKRKKYIFKKKYEVNKKNKIEEFNKLEEIIKSEITNIKFTLDKEVNKYKFLKDIISEKPYYEIIRNFIYGNDVKENVEIIEKLLFVKNNLKSLTNEIETYDKGVIDILKYAYENVEDKETMVDVIENIEIFNANYEIEKRELSNINTDNYKIYDEIINEIIEDQISRENYINHSIKYVWENKIKEELKINNGSYIILENDYLDTYTSLFPIQIGLKGSVDEGIIKKFNSVIDISEDSITLFKDYEDKNIEIKNSMFLSDDIINLYKYNKENNYHNILLNYLNSKYINLTTNFKVDNINLPFYIESESDKFCLIIDDIDKLNYDLYKELYFISVIKEYNIKIIRVWIRDLWEDSNKVFKSINKEINNN